MDRAWSMRRWRTGRVVKLDIDDFEVYQNVANLIINELMPRLARAGIEADASPVTPEQISIAALAKAYGVMDTHTIRRLMDEAFNKEEMARGL